jgi:hypothetical protein
MLKKNSPYTLAFQGGTVSMASGKPIKDITTYLDDIEFTSNKETNLIENNKKAINKPEKKIATEIKVINSISLKSSGTNKKDANSNILKVFGNSSVNAPVTEANDSKVGNYFKFVISRDQDKINDEYNATINLKNLSNSRIIAGPNQAVMYSWKMKINNGMTFSSKPTGFFDIYGYNSYNTVSVVVGHSKTSKFNEATSTYPLFNLAGLNDNGKMYFQIAKQDGLNIFPAILSEVDFNSIKGKWLQLEFTVKYSEKGYYKFVIKDLNGNEIMYCEKDNVKTLFDANFENYYPIWGIVRAADKDLISNEDEVDFADFTIEKISLKIK